jgi:predicted Zn-dependent protease
MPVVRDGQLQNYVERIGRKLLATGVAGDYPYAFKLVNDPSINAFALPGGPTFVNTGLLRAVDNEAQLAGVMAHEISHVALRHGTNQASKANLIQLPAMLAGAVVGNGSMLGQLAQLGIGLGANSVLLKYSRNAESDADILGARMMAKAGYNPIEMARFF